MRAIAIVSVAAMCVLITTGALAQTFSSETRKDGETRVSWSDDVFSTAKVEIRTRGDIAFTDDDRDVRRLSPNSYLYISEQHRGGISRRLELRPTPDGNFAERRYFVDSSESAYDSEGRDWLARILPTVIRRTGIAAEERVARILTAKGVVGMLNEISVLESDHIAGKYFRLLLAKANPNGAVLRDILNQAGREIESDNELSGLLRDNAEKAMADPLSRAAYFGAALSVGSDHESRRVLGAAMRDTLPADGVAQALHVARSIGSDHQLAELLMEVGGEHLRNAPVRSAFFEALRVIRSDNEKRRVLTWTADLTNLSPEMLSSVLLATRNIGSDHELAVVLMRLAARHPLKGGLRDQYLEAASHIGSDNEKKQVLAALAKSPQ